MPHRMLPTHRITFVVGLAAGYVLGTRAGRERYEEIKKAARDFMQNPAVRNAAESAALSGRGAATKAFHAVGEQVTDLLPDAVAARANGLRNRGSGGDGDDWGPSNT
ncbi:YtxH domain-containing protein [Streptomyces sp. A7024]|uniref:YtxH domain-containing protein n=1 Tax=Streptomyces coryli TaxID=1128680 RepID=A0A6G4TZ64_9ACTN|nr:YtxH domain-containing protein [Streptomyces coryli]NGN64810.1 YtxH domain-containing protein [Streptomyces coryli]